jgi:mycothiol synthase
VEHDRLALFRAFGLEPVYHWVNLARSLNGNLPPVKLPAGIRLRTLDPERDIEAAWRVDNAAFRGLWNHVEVRLEEYQHLVNGPYIPPELFFLAEDEATRAIVGLAMNGINLERIAQTGRQEGYIDTLAVLRAYRRRGVGTALLAQSLHALKQSGMESADLDADSENRTGALRLYQRMGFQVRRRTIVHWRVMQEE